MLYPMRDTFSLRQGLIDLINYAEEHLGDLSTKTIIEIGSYAGESSVIFAKRFKQVICIDPFIDHYDPNDIAARYAPFSAVESAFDNAVSAFSNIVKIKATSDDAVRMILGKHDMVYIDGMHTYEQVIKDISNYKTCLKPKCIVSGHDYHTNWIGVKNAVDYCLGQPHHVFQDTSWAVKIN